MSNESPPVTMRRAWCWTVAAAVIAVLCGPVGIRLFGLLQVAPLPERFYSLAALLWGWTFLAPLIWFAIALGGPIVAVGFTLSKDYRKFAPLVLAVTFVAWLSWPLSFELRSLRRGGLIRAAQRAEPLIAAIEAYRAANGQYPASLYALVPRYIDHIPSTGMVGYPRFLYQLPEQGSLFRRYELSVRTPSVGVNFDVFVYWPEKQYPARMYGGSIERIGDWAYVHE